MHAVVLIVFFHDGAHRFEGQLRHQGDFFLLVMLYFGLAVELLIKHSVEDLTLSGEVL